MSSRLEKVKDILEFATYDEALEISLMVDERLTELRNKLLERIGREDLK